MDSLALSGIIYMRSFPAPHFALPSIQSHSSRNVSTWSWQPFWTEFSNYIMVMQPPPPAQQFFFPCWVGGNVYTVIQEGGKSNLLDYWFKAVLLISYPYKMLVCENYDEQGCSVKCGIASNTRFTTTSQTVSYIRSSDLTLTNCAFVEES